MNELKKGADINAAIKIKENDVEVSDSETYSFTYSCPDYETTLVHILKKKKKNLHVSKSYRGVRIENAQNLTTGSGSCKHFSISRQLKMDF